MDKSKHIAALNSEFRQAMRDVVEAAAKFVADTEEKFESMPEGNKG